MAGFGVFAVHELFGREHIGQRETNHDVGGTTPHGADVSRGVFVCFTPFGYASCNASTGLRWCL